MAHRILSPLVGAVHQCRRLGQPAGGGEAQRQHDHHGWSRPRLRHRRHDPFRPVAGRHTNAVNSAPVEALNGDTASPMHIRFVKLKYRSNDRPDLQSTNKVTSGAVVTSVPRRTSTLFSSTWIRAMLRSVPREPPSTPAMRPVTYSKITAPNSCAATGTASAIRHMMGIKEAVIMVPFNKDDEAPPWKSPTLVLRGTCSRSFRNWGRCWADNVSQSRRGTTRIMRQQQSILRREGNTWCSPSPRAPAQVSFCLSSIGCTGWRGSAATSKLNHDKSNCIPMIIGKAASITVPAVDGM